jgi:hypothetical protein
MKRHAQEHSMQPSSTVLRALAALAACALFFGCERKIEGILPTPEGTGPAVSFDLMRRPMPEVPFPNDIATRSDLSSPTGRRINSSIVAPTTLETEVRQEFDLLDGWGTFAAITVSFDEPIDPLPIRAAHGNDSFDDDAVYVVNLQTLEPVRLDLGRGNFPVTLQNTDKFFPNDPRANTSNLLFETVEETDTNGNGVLDSEEDTDHDGVWDHPNTIGPDQYRDLLTFYEKQSRTLIIRTMVPLEQRTTYAVVLTRRIKGTDGQPVRSPFPFVNHPSQTKPLQALVGGLGKGSLAGLTPDDVAFAWTFTTQTTTKDLEALREGLYQRGPLAWVGKQVSDRLEPVLYADDKTGRVTEFPLHPMKSAKAPAGENLATWAVNPYLVPMSQFTGALTRLTDLLGVDSGIDSANLLDTFKFVDYMVIGSFQTPDLVDDPTRPTFDGIFRVDAEHGLARLWTRPEGWKELETQALTAEFKAPIAAETLALRLKAQRATRDRVWFMLTVPKAHDGFKAPFPVSIYGHGYTSQRTEALGFAGNLAKLGIASVSIDSYGHGLAVGEVDRKLIEAIIGSYGFTPATRAILKGRARDLNNDGLVDTGGDFWTADIFHTRDVVRQSVIDWVQLVRVFRAFGTYELGDLNGDGKPELAGDFNGDGVIDVGGPDQLDGKHNPGSDFFVWGQSLGGILAGIMPAVEPKIVAAAPVSGCAGNGDVGIRSEQGGVVKAVYLEVMGPMLISEPVSPGLAHLTYVAQDVNDEHDVRLTTTPLDLRPGDHVEAYNLNTKNGEPQKRDDAIVDADGKFRLQVASDAASFLEDSPVDKTPIHIGVCDEKTAETSAQLKLRRPADCIVFKRTRPGAPDLVIDTFPSDVVFQERHYAQGTPLIALSRGFAFKRGTPELRRFIGLAQTAVEPGDSANYAAHYFKDLLPARKDNPAAVLVVGTTGDLNVPINTAYAQGRIAGVLPYVYDPVKHAAWGMSPNDVLIESHAMEALEKLNYFEPLGAYLRNPSAPVAPRDQAMIDLVTCRLPEHCEKPVLADVSNYAYDPATGTYLDEGNTKYQNGGVPRLKHSLRDAMISEYDATDGDGNAVKRKSAMITPYLDARGKHTFGSPYPEEAFDINLFMINLVGRYFQTRGTDLRFDICMHRDGYDRSRLKPDGTPDLAAQRVPGCEFIPNYPATF